MSRFNGKRAEFEASGEKINVAILGAGRIAHTMAGTLTQMAEDSLYSSWIHPYAVAARDITRAQAFADQWHFDKAYGSYEELVEMCIRDRIRSCRAVRHLRRWRA